MIRLIDYIYENMIMEGTIKDWKHLHNGDDYFYPRAVIKDLLDGKQVALGEKINNITGYITIDDFDKSKLEEIYNNIEKYNKDDFRMASKSQKILLSKVFKGAYSKCSTESSAGADAERLVCYIYNGNKNTQNIIDMSSKLGLDESWITSSQLTCSIINSSWPSSQYILVHVDGKDLDENISSEYKDIARLFKSKKDASNILNIDLNNLYVNGKDTWNKADVVLIKKNLSILNEIKSYVKTKKIIESNGFNDMLKMFLLENKIIPISLKKLYKRGKLEKHNIDSIQNTNIYKDIQLHLPVKQLNGNGRGTIELYPKSEPKTRVQFRCGTDSKPTLWIELEIKGARGGKGTSNIKNQLNITSIPQLSEKEIINGFKKYFNTEIPSYIKETPDWYERVAFNGLIYIMNAFWEKYQNKASVDAFFNFCIGACNSTGSFYKISEA